MEKRERPSYEEIIKSNPSFIGVIPPVSWDFIGKSSKGTREFLIKLWNDNIRQNVKNRLWKKHGSLKKDCIGLGKNKALIAVGAGQSFNKNKDVLKSVADNDGVKSWADRDFIIVASNHMFKPLLNMNIIPDFVMLTDASDVVMNQLNVDIPSSGQNTTMIAGIHCSPKVLEEWANQGRGIRFYLPSTIGLDETFKEATHKNPIYHQVLPGGNVLNTLWSVGMVFFQSRNFMALGNDLSYPLKDNIEKQRETYYADADYSSNIKETGTGRDEASADKQWLGFTLKPCSIYTGELDRYNVQLDLVGTSPTLWVYKTWIEVTVLIHTRFDNSFHYFNCSEAGILGVMNESMDFVIEELKDDSKWFLMDRACSRWHTMMFKDAIEKFLQAKENFKCREIIPLDVQNVSG